MKIRKDTQLSEILTESPELAMILVEAGMGCVGCPMAMQETLEQGCMGHGLGDEEIEELIKKMNNKLEEIKTKEEILKEKK